MIETLVVSISGPAFAFVVHETTKSTYCQEGFLLGQIKEKKSRTITDNDQQEEHIDRTIVIDSCISCPNTCYFYDSVGKVDEEKVKDFLGEATNRVVAWYKYKPTLNTVLTFREKIIHLQLARCFDIPPELFSCCVMVTESSDNNSTHSYSQTFVRYHNNMQQIPMHIKNLSDSSNTYLTPEPSSKILRKVLDGLKIGEDGLQTVRSIHSALARHMNSLVDGLSDAESRLVKLEEEVKKIQETKKNRLIVNSDDKEEKLSVKGKKRTTNEIAQNKHFEKPTELNSTEGITTRLRRRK